VSKISQVTVLAEDERHQRFAKGYLERCGIGGYAVRYQLAPSGRECAEQWVRQTYSKEVAVCRRRQARTWLLVLIDADTKDVQYRAQQLAASLQDSLQKARSRNEPVAHLVPKRNIETWVLCLNGKTVDEETDYRRDPTVDSQIRTAAEAFFGCSRDNPQPQPTCVPSPLTAIPEVRRLR
jgi:hypothetical protein